MPGRWVLRQTCILSNTLGVSGRSGFHRGAASTVGFGRHLPSPNSAPGRKRRRPYIDRSVDAPYIYEYRKVCLPKTDAGGMKLDFDEWQRLVAQTGVVYLWAEDRTDFKPRSDSHPQDPGGRDGEAVGPRRPRARAGKPERRRRSTGRANRS